MAKGLRSVFILFTIFMVVTTFTAHVNCQNLVECFDMCGVLGVSLGTRGNILSCCISGGGGYIVVSDQAAGCRPCPSGEVTTETPTEDISTGATTSPPAINECELGTDNCNKMRLYSYGHYGQRGMSVNHMRIGICTDTEDGFICSCAPGFEGDGIECQDINECELETAETKLCHQEARCFNRMGSFRCRCKPGNVGDGINCCLSVKVINQLRASSNNQDDDQSGSRASRRSRKSTPRRRGNRFLKSQRRPQKSKSSHSERRSSRSIGSNISISDIDPACDYVLWRYGIDPAAMIEDTFTSRSTPRRSSKSKHGRKGKKG